MWSTLFDPRILLSKDSSFAALPMLSGTSEDSLDKLSLLVLDRLLLLQEQVVVHQVLRQAPEH